MTSSIPVGTVLFFVVVGIGIAGLIFLLVRGAGPDWMWALGRRDPVRNLFFRPDGSWRRYGRIGLLGILVVMVAASYFGL